MIYLTATRFSLSCCARVFCLSVFFFLKIGGEKKVKKVDDDLALGKKEQICVGFHLNIDQLINTEEEEKAGKAAFSLPRACVCQCARISRDKKAKKTRFVFTTRPSDTVVI
jgi:hypothetical protein